MIFQFVFFFSSRRRHTRLQGDWSSDVCSSDLNAADDAVRHFKKAVSLAPDFYAARNNLGLMYLTTQNFVDAEQQFREVVRLHPTDSQAYFNLGNTCLLSQRF